MKKHSSETMNTAQSVLSSIADSAAEGIQKGTEDASKAVGKTLRVIKKGAYKGCYYLSFGVVYSAKIAMNLLPQDSVIRYGLKDGAQAAKAAYELRHSVKQTGSVIIEEQALNPVPTR